MSDIAIRVENLSKQYRIGALQKDGGYSYKSLRDSIASAASAPFRMARNLIGRNGAEDNHHDEIFWALKDVSFNVKKGEIVGVIGRNGAGKSTLLKVLSRITEPTTGRVEIHGRIGSLLEVGTGFHPELTGRDNVFMNGAILGMKRAEIAKNFDDIVAFAGVSRFIDTPVKHYSSGMYLRLAFAVAAHLQTEILIVDEVLAVGDAEFQNKCLGKMEEVSQGGRTVVFVSHNIPAISRLCPLSCWIEAGRIKQFGKTPEILNKYLQHGRVSAKGWICPNPESKTMSYIQEIAISNATGDPTGTLTICDSVAVNIRVNNPSRAHVCQVAVRVSTVDGNPVFTTTSTDSSLELTVLGPGQSEFRFNIPANFLNAGLYSVICAILVPGGELIDVVADQIRVEIHQGLNHATHFQDFRQGVVTPLLAWSEVHNVDSKKSVQRDFEIR